MRIVAGRFRGRSLAAVGKGDPANALRPTTDRVREALFNVLAGGRFGDPFEGPVLDLFAGTGALGLEALSRGATHATFVESGRKALGILRLNVAQLDVSDKTTIIARDVRKLPENTGEPARLAVLDPPYGKNLGAFALDRAGAMGWLAPGTLVVWEEAKEQPAPEGFERLDCRRYGDTAVTFLQRQ